MLQKNKYIFDETKVKLPKIYKEKLNDVVKEAITIFHNNLKSITLGGSGGKAEIIPFWSDLDIYILYWSNMILNKFNNL